MNLIYAVASGDEPDSEVASKGNLYPKMRQLRRSLSDDPARYKTTQQAADFIGISVSRFAHLYREYFDVTFTNDLISARIKRACMLLRTTDWTISRIANEVGYENDIHFYRQFKKQISFSPNQYRIKNATPF